MLMILRWADICHSPAVRRMLSVALAVLVVYGCLLLAVWLWHDRLIFFPTRLMMATPQDIGLAYEEVWLETADDLRLFAWFVPATEARGTLLFLHGNAGNISHRLDSIALFHQLSMNVFIIDYRGYGLSDGRPSEAGVYQDAAAAWVYLVETRGAPPAEIVIFGRSLGGGVASWLAAEEQPAGLILESTFTAVPDVAAELYPWLPVRRLLRTEFNTLARMADIERPVLIIHSPDDEIIPFHHGRTLYEAAPHPKTFLTIQGGHNDGFLRSTAVYRPALDDFFTAVLPAPP